MPEKSRKKLLPRYVYLNEGACQDSLKKEFDAEVEQLKIATETTVLPLLETVGEKIGRKPLLKCSLPFESLPAEVHGYIGNYEKSQEGIRRKAQEKAYGKTKDGRLDDILTGRIFYEYPSIQVTLTFRDEVAISHWEADSLISPAEYLNVSCIRKQGKTMQP